MKKILLSGAALLALAAPAAAADLARYPVKAAAPVAVPVFSWTGFYIGGNVGWAWLNNELSVSPAFGIPPTSISIGDANGFTGGLQAGYNWQFVNNVVLGIEADVQWADLGSSSVVIVPAGPFAAGVSSASLDVYGTVRARLGYVFDRVLPYVTGGLAWGTTDYGSIYGVDTSKTNWGWTVGGGVEYAITNNWTAKIEYQYIDLEGSSYTIPGTLGSISADTQLNVVKLGVNYKF
ncbi:outer membrane protein [Aquabacter spiritensis]|uniref:Outer membrane immunogenic protein n=1 Tax=Aquabacter spiritensis TaxID=933073 RepID=A0A4R3LUX8_9HYPH|nr:outer membrane protein [Aquabacter spiritensis]TCT04353.1 outer membrane immunogenic protein [Aquabacter spiritensis]